MSWILVTNDDGIDSPALVPLINALAELGEVAAVVPDRERSWIGKAISRHGDITLAHTQREGIEIATCSGYPADCIQLGAHHLRPEPPKLVVSGVNIGYNHGAGFVLGSGTVGAALEGWSSGIDSVALSAGTMSDFHQWRTEVLGPDATAVWTRLAEISADIVAGLLAADAWDHCDIVNVNLPSGSTLDTPRRLTELARVGYNPLFEPISPPSGDAATATDQGTDFRFVRELRLVRRGQTGPSDVDAARDGAISINPLHFPDAEAAGKHLRAALER